MSDRMKRKPSMADDFSPQGESIQIILKRRGKPVAGIYKDEKAEIRSPSLQQKKDDAE